MASISYANEVSAQTSDRLELYRTVGDQLTTIFHAFIHGGVLKGDPDTLSSRVQLVDVYDLTIC